MLPRLGRHERDEMIHHLHHVGTWSNHDYLLAQMPLRNGQKRGKLLEELERNVVLDAVEPRRVEHESKRFTHR